MPSLETTVVIKHLLPFGSSLEGFVCPFKHHWECRASRVLQCTEGVAAAGHEMAQQIPLCCWEQRAEPWRNGKSLSFGDPLPAKQSHGQRETSIYPSQQTCRSSLPAPYWWMLPKGCTQPPICPSIAVSPHNDSHRHVLLCRNNRGRKSASVSSSSIDTAGRAGAGVGLLLLQNAPCIHFVAPAALEEAQLLRQQTSALCKSIPGAMLGPPTGLQWE